MPYGLPPLFAHQSQKVVAAAEGGDALFAQVVLFQQRFRSAPVAAAAAGADAGNFILHDGDVISIIATPKNAAEFSAR